MRRGVLDQAQGKVVRQTVHGWTLGLQLDKCGPQVLTRRSP